MASDSVENERLSPRQEAAALALASGCTLAAAAVASKAGERTINTWLAKVPALRRRISELRADMTSQSLGRMANAMSDAADVLKRLLEAESESVRLSAARSILELGVKLRETVEFEERLVALEARAAAKDGGKAS
jgi:hypothetical protein